MYIHKNFKILKTKNILTCIYVCRVYNFLFTWSIVALNILHSVIALTNLSNFTSLVFYNLINNI